MNIVVTGIGMVGPYGVGVAPFWEGLNEGRSPLAASAQPEFGGALTGELRDFDAAAHLGKGLRSIDRVTRMLMVAAQEALAHGKLELTDEVKEELGVVVGSAFSSLRSTANFFTERLEGGPENVTASQMGNGAMNGPANQLAIRFGMKRINTTLTSGFASGVDAIGYAMRMIDDGRLPAVLVGGADELGPETHAFLRSLGADAVPGEGAVFLLLESEEHASKRQAPVLARLSGYGSAFDPVALQGQGVRSHVVERAMAHALKSAGREPAGVTTVVAAAVGPAQEQAEAEAFDRLFGHPVSTLAPKRMLGETMGAAGAFGAAIAVLGLQQGRLPLTTGSAERVLVNAVSYSGHCAAVLVEPA